jgi:hypothetical protein
MKRDVFNIIIAGHRAAAVRHFRQGHNDRTLTRVRK